MIATHWLVCGSGNHWAWTGTSPRGKRRTPGVPGGKGLPTAGCPPGAIPATAAWDGAGELGLLDCGAADDVAGLRVAAVHAPLIDGRDHVGPPGHHAGMNLDGRGGEEAAQPVLSVSLSACRRGGFHGHAAPPSRRSPCFAAGRVVGVIDPQHGFVAPRRSRSLEDAAVAPQHPDFEAALLPAVGRLGGDEDRLRPVEVGQLDGGGRRAAGQAISTTATRGELRGDAAMRIGAPRTASRPSSSPEVLAD